MSATCGPISKSSTSAWILTKSNGSRTWEPLEGTWSTGFCLCPLKSPPHDHCLGSISLSVKPRSQSGHRFGSGVCDPCRLSHKIHRAGGQPWPDVLASSRAARHCSSKPCRPFLHVIHNTYEVGKPTLLL